MMFGSETLEVAIGLAVLFTFMSLFASALRETIEARVKRRAQLVHKGIAQIVSADGNQNDEMLKKFYETIVISPLFQGAYAGAKGKLPAYITSSNFASAMLELARQEANGRPASAVSEWIGELKDSRVSQLVRIAFASASKDPDKTRAFLEHWFDGQMDRVSGWYKRETHWWLIGIGLVAAVLLNVDAIAVTKHLYRNDAMRAVIVAHAEAKPPAVGGEAAAPVPATGGQIADELHDYGFPIGWSLDGTWPAPTPQCELRSDPRAGCSFNALGPLTILLMMLGWAVTALGISLGAPFWFDVLNKVMVIRSTVKPDEKSPPEASKDRQAPPAPVTLVGAIDKQGEPAGKS